MVSTGYLKKDVARRGWSACLVKSRPKCLTGNNSYSLAAWPRDRNLLTPIEK